MTEKELYALLRDCRNDLCLKCGWYRNAHNGACNGCRWKDLDIAPMKNRTAQFYPNEPDTIWSYYVARTCNPCGCGSNCYHHEYDGKRVIGVCNACGTDIYEVKEEFVKRYLAEGVWKEINKPI